MFAAAHSGYMVHFFDRYFVLEDATLKYWKNAAEYEVNPGKPKNIVKLNQSQITVVQEEHAQGFVWFIAGRY